MLKTAVVHDQHDQVNAFDADLQSPTASANRDECRSAPAFRRAASSHTTPVLATKDEAAFEQVRHYDDAFGAVQHFFRNAFVGCGHDRLQNLNGFLHAVDSFFPV